MENTNKNKMEFLNRKYSELFNEQDYKIRGLNIIMSEFAEIALLKNQARHINKEIQMRQARIVVLHKDYLRGEE